MVFNRKDIAKAFSPNKHRRFTKQKRLSNSGLKPSTSGSTSIAKVTSGTSSQNAQTRFKVIIRVRPENAKEEGHRNIVKVVDEKMLIFDPKEEENPFFYRGVEQKRRDLLKRQHKELQFIFDRIFDGTSCNNDVFMESTKDLISNLLEGYNCSVFAYGATGAGKTHTMLGSESDPGITFRTVEELFKQIEAEKERRDFNLGVTYLEVYNENVHDLLHKTGALHIRDNGRSGIVIAGLKVITIESAEELLHLLDKGNQNRTQHPTDANAESSRSHAVFQVYINITEKIDGQVKHVKLSMVDLAGSERASATGCKGARFKEGANINQSLLALGNCINKLADGVSHIPYRDSKLTRLLKDSLGGNCRTVMIANVSPSNLSYEDTYNTLRYADRAKKIKTNVRKNIVSCEMHITTYIKVVEELKKENAVLKQRILELEKQERTERYEKPSDIIKRSLDSEKILNEHNSLWKKKLSLNEKILSLVSSDKILLCRMQYKKNADSRLRNLTTNIDVVTPEQNASGKSRVNKSLVHFERQRESLKIQIESYWEELKSVVIDLQRIEKQMRAKEIRNDDVTVHEKDLDKIRCQCMYEHTKKLSTLQQCEMKSCCTIIQLLSTKLQAYHNMMQGYGNLTESMKLEFKQLIKSLEGVKNIKWVDADPSNQEETFYNLLCLNTEDLDDPVSNAPPVFSNISLEDEKNTPVEVSQHNSTITLEEPSSIHPITKPVEAMDASPSSRSSQKDDECITSPEGHNGVNLADLETDRDSGNEKEEDEVEEEENKEQILNNTFTTKGKKRVLVDANKDIKTSVKQRKVVSKDKSLERPNGLQEKENRERVPTMSARSIAILNKLKKETAAAASNCNGNDSNENRSLKAVRSKERKGLNNSHPYKPLNTMSKQKPTPSIPSSRVPW